MNITPVSFCKKIPVSQCCIKDNTTKSFIPATLVELDCTDISDIVDVALTKGDWEYKKAITYNMYDKHKKITQSSFRPNVSFYALVKGAGDIVGLMQVRKLISGLNIDLIESERTKNYKYVGKNMVAGLGTALKHMVKDTIEVDVPLAEAVPFYESCGFKRGKNRQSFIMDEQTVEKLQHQLEEKTQSPFIDLLW